MSLAAVCKLIVKSIAILDLILAAVATTADLATIGTNQIVLASLNWLEDC
jgi:hypothetical protein